MMRDSGLRIAVWYNLPACGAKRQVYDHVRGLVGRGHHVEVWCTSESDTSYLPLSGLVEEHCLPLESPAVPSLPLESPAVPNGGRVAWMFHPGRQAAAAAEAMDRHTRLCAEQIRRGGFDLLYANTCITHSSPPIGRHVDLPSAFFHSEPKRDLYEARVMLPDGPCLPWVTPMPPPPPRRGLAGRLSGARSRLQHAVYERSLIRSLRRRAQDDRANVLSFDALLANSRYSRESILRIYGVDAHVCYLGVDTDAFRPVGAAKEPYVVGLGGLYASKRPDLAIRALGTIEPARRPPLVWIGTLVDPEYLQEIRRLASDLGVDFRPRVRVSHEELVDLLGRAAAMAYVSRLEPFGYAPLEANACGTAVVGVAEGGVRETVRDGDNGTLLDFPDPEQIGRALLRYTSDLELAAEAGRRSRRRVEEHWTYEASIDRLEAHLIRVAEGRAAPEAAGSPAPEGSPCRDRQLSAS